MRILVTGGAGFIGSHIVDMLVERDYRVLVVDNLSTGREDNLNPRAEFSSTDIRSRELFGLVSKFQPEIVIHHAAQVSVPKSLKNPVDDAMINVLGTVNLLEACRQAGVRKIIYASSAAVYGDPVYLPVDEKHPVKPDSFYGLSKHTCERYLELYRKIYGLNYTVLRYANVYGPRQDGLGEGGVVAKFIDSICRELPPVIYGNGKQTRDFIYVKDAAGANLAVLSAGDNQVLNISTGQPTSINKLFSLLKDTAGFPGEAVRSPPRPGDIKDSCLDNTKAAEKINWKPGYTLKQGLIETYFYVKTKR